MKYKVIRAQLIFFSLSFPFRGLLSPNVLLASSMSSIQSGLFSVDLGTTIGALQIGSIFLFYSES
jgi:hypothetical protein